MIRFAPFLIVVAAVTTGCSSPSKNPDYTYGSPSQQARQAQDTSMGPDMGSGANDGQGYKGGSGVGAGRTAEKF